MFRPVGMKQWEWWREGDTTGICLESQMVMMATGMLITLLLVVMMAWALKAGRLPINIVKDVIVCII